MAALAFGALVVAGCGSGKDYANSPRPAAPIVITASITPARVLVSPHSFGAGPISLVIANETSSSHRVTLETDQIGGSSAGLRQETAPINPRDTASLKVDVPQGSYVVRVDGGSIRAARIDVGPPRPSAQDKLLQP
ncbi:MAG: hypothetical protein QOI98_1312 [Solirubrobacteraceae bacterium]|jgi:hypothetical protein|nr:hypothetical protein [Solirubrobacteraceae bacterium]